MRRDLGQVQSDDDESQAEASGDGRTKGRGERAGTEAGSDSGEGEDEDEGPLDTQKLHADTQRILRGEQASSGTCKRTEGVNVACF